MLDDSEFQVFLDAYIECALWSSNDESDESGGEPLDKNYGKEDLAEETLAKCAFDCAAFLARAHALLDDASCARSQYSKAAQAGHDFWLTRNGHGAGFCDGDWTSREEDEMGRAERGERMGDKLSALCGWRTEFREVNVYIGDDGKLYIS